MSKTVLKTVMFALMFYAASTTAWAGATTFTWTGNSDGFWSNAGNWDPTGTPGSTDDVIMTGDGATPFLDTDPVINNLSVQAGSRLSLNGRSLTVNGDLIHTISNSSGDGITMDQSTDELTVQGNATFSHVASNSTATTLGQFTAGTIRFGGNFTQITGGGSSNGQMFVSSGTLVIFNGINPQTVTFSNAALSQSRFHDLRVANPSGVTFNSNVAVTGLLDLGTLIVTDKTGGGGLLNQSDAFAVLVENQLPDPTFGTYNVANTLVLGDVVMTSDRTYPLAANNLLVDPSHSLSLNGHTLDLGGDLNVQISNSTGDGLIMQQGADNLIVRGNATFTHTASNAGATSLGNLTAGIISFHGNLLQTNGGGSTNGQIFVSSGTLARFDGTAPQTVEMINPGANASRFHGVTIANPAGVNFISNIYVDGVLDMETGGVLTQSAGASVFYTNALPITNTGYQIPLSRVAGDITLASPVSLPSGANLQIDAGFSLNVGGQSLSVGGDLTVTISNTAGDGLIMQGSTDEVIVNGAATFTHQPSNSSATSEGNFSGGLLRLRGDFVQTTGGGSSNGQIFVSTGTLVLFDGSAVQNVSFGNPGETASRFDQVSVANPVGVNFNSDVYVTGLLSVATPSLLGAPVLNQSADFDIFYTGTLPQVGDGTYNVVNTSVRAPIALIQSVTLPFPQNNLNILATEHLNLNGQTLDVGGNLTVVVSNAAGDGLLMQNSTDLLKVHGTATFTHTASNASATSLGNFTSGRMELFGDFLQTTGGGSSNGQMFISTGTEVVFKGTTPQHVFFNNPGETTSRFDHVAFANAAGVTLDTNVYVDGLLQLTSPDGGGSSLLQQAATEGLFVTTALPQITNGTFDVANTYVRAPMVMTQDITLPLPQNNLGVLATESLALGGFTLSVGGDLTVIISNTTGDGLILNLPTDTLMVNGNATFTHASGHGSATSIGNFSDGTIHFRRDFTQTTGGASSNGQMFISTGTDVIFDGTAPQTVSFTNPGTDLSRFNNVQVSNPAGVTLTTDVVVTGQLEMIGSGVLTQAAALGGPTVLYTFALPITNAGYQVGSSVVAGSIFMDRDTVIPNGGSLSNLAGASLSLNSQTLTVDGDLTVLVSNATADGLLMNASTDTLIVNGNATFTHATSHASATSEGNFSDGVIHFRGNFLQTTGGGSSTGQMFVSTGTRVIFDRITNFQSIQFDQPGATRSRFNDVTIPAGAFVGLNSDVYLDGNYTNLGSTQFHQLLTVGGGIFTNDVDANLYGSGQIELSGGTLTNHGLITIQVQPGKRGPLNTTMGINGNFQQSTTGAILPSINDSQVAYDLNVSGTATLAGSIEVVSNNYTPTNGDVFTLFTYAGTVGDFDQYTGLDLGQGFTLEPTLSNTALTVETVGPQIYHWINTSGGDWEVPTNWDPEGVPGPNDIAIIDQNVPVPIVINQDTHIQSLILGSSTTSPGLLLENVNLTLEQDSIIHPKAALNLTNASILYAESSMTPLTLSVEGILNATGQCTIDVPLTIQDGGLFELYETPETTNTTLDFPRRLENNGFFYVLPNQTNGNITLDVFDGDLINNGVLIATGGETGLFDLQGSFMNNGEFQVTTNATLIPTTGQTNVNQGVLFLLGDMNLGDLENRTGSLLVGSGTWDITGQVVNTGSLSPGNIQEFQDASDLTIKGDLILDPTGTLQIDVFQDEDVTRLDQMIFSNPANLAGTLKVVLGEGDSLQPFEDDILQYPSVSGSFAETILPLLPNGLTPTVDQGPEAVTLTANHIKTTGTQLYAYDSLSGRLYDVDPTSEEVLTYYDMGLGDIFLATSPNGSRLLAANTDSDQFMLINTADGAVLDMNTNIPEPGPIAVMPDNQTAWIFSDDTDGAPGFVIYDLLTMTQTGSLTDACFAGTTGLAFSPNGQTAYAVNTFGSLCQVDVVERVVTGSVILDKQLDDVILSRDGAKLYATARATGTLHVVDTGVLSSTSIFIAGQPLHMALDDDGYLYIGKRSEEMGVVNTADDDFFNLAFTDGISIFDIAIVPELGQGYLSDLTFDSLVSFNLIGTVAAPRALPGTLDIGAPTVLISNPSVETQPPQIAFSADTYTVLESDEVAQIEILRLDSGADPVTVTVRDAPGGTAVPNQDYLPFSENVTFAAGETSKTVVVDLIDDTQVAPAVTVNLEIVPEVTTPQLGGAGVLDTAVLVIEDVEAGAVQFSAATYSVDEFQPFIDLTVNRVGGTDGDLTFRFQTLSGTATPGQDYVGADEMVTIAAGQSSTTVRVTLLDDQIQESDEDVALQLSVDGNVSDTATLVIMDFEAGTALFTSPTYQVDESGETALITLERVGGQDGSLFVRFETTLDGTATANEDYLPVSTTLTFEPGQTQASATVTIFDDSIQEGNETVSLTLADVEAKGPHDTATLEIIDDAPGTVVFANPAPRVAENNGFANIQLLRQGGVKGSLSVLFTTANGSADAGADYVAVEEVVTFEAGQTTQTVTVPILDDALEEGDETVNLLINSVDVKHKGTSASAVLTIEDYEEGRAVFASATYAADENAGDAAIQLTRTGGEDGALTVIFTTADGTAEAEVDYLPVSTAVTFADGQTTQTVAVPLIADDQEEGDETVNLFLSDPEESLGDPGRLAVLTILDAVDPGEISFAVSQISASESDEDPLIVLNRAPTSGPVSVMVDVVATNGARNGSDFLFEPMQINFESGQSTATFPFDIINDTTMERVETVTLQLSDPTGGARIGARDTFTIRILDNDEARVSFTTSDQTVAETVGTVTVTARLSNPTQIRIAAPILVSGGEAGLDYTLSADSFVFLSGQRTATVQLQIIDNDVDQPDRDLLLDLNSGRVGTNNPSTLTVTILDNDEPVTVNWLGADVSQQEGRRVTLTAALSRAVDADQTVAFTLSGDADDADYNLVSQALVFPAGAEQTTLTVNLLDDDVQEPSETLTLTLVDSDALVGPDASRTITILDDDQPSVTWLSESQTVVEDDTAKRAFTVSVTARLKSVTNQSIQVPYFIGGTATAGVDYDLSPGFLVFEPGDISTTLSFQILGDTQEEPTENIALRLLDGDVPLGGIIEHQILIQDNDLDQAPDTRLLEPLKGAVFAPGQTVQFRAEASDPQGDAIAAVTWEIRSTTGPGRILSGAEVTDTFDLPGIYEIAVFATDSAGNEDRSPARGLFEIAANQPPVVTITQPAQEELTVTIGTTVTFTAQANDPDDTSKTVDVSWFLINKPDVTTPGDVFSTTFNQAGTFTVAARAVDDEGSTATDFVTVRVAPQDEPFPPGLIIVSPQRNATFVTGQLIDLVSATRNDAPIPPSWTAHWDLGDGRVMEGVNIPGVTYSKPGRYTVTFYLLDEEGGRRALKRTRIFIQDPDRVPSVDFNIPIGWRLEPGATAKRTIASEIFFEAIVKDNAGYENLDFFWEFGDGRTSRLATPGRIGYDTPGLYVVSLFVVTPTGKQSAIQTRSILVEATLDSANEPNNTFDDAPGIRPGQYENLTLDAEDDGDFFRVSVKQPGQRLVVELRSDDILDASIYNADRQLLETRRIEQRGNLQLRGLAVGDYFVTLKPAPTAKRMGLSFSMGLSVLQPALFFPEIRVDETFDTQLGMVNTTNATASVDATAYDTAGNVVAVSQLQLPAMGRCHETIADLFGDAAARTAWVRVDSAAELVGYSRTSDRDFQKLYAVTASKNLSSELFVPHIAEAVNQWETRASVVNGDDLETASIIEAPDRDVILNLDKGFAADRFDFLERFDGSLPAGDAWARLRDTNEAATLAGVEVFGTIDGSRVVAGLELADVRRTDPNFTFASNTLYFTHVANDTANFWTGIALVNPGDFARTVKITGYDAAGQTLGDKTLELDPRAKLVAVADSVLEGVGSAANVAWFRAESDSEIVGFELFGTHDGERMAGLEASSNLRRELCYPFIDTDPDVVHGISVVNPGNATAAVTLELRDNQGQLLGSVDQSLNANQKLTVTIEALFDQLGINAGQTGWLAIKSDQPLAGFELFLSQNAAKAQMGAVTAQ